jgi:serine/threonine protein kinase
MQNVVGRVFLNRFRVDDVLQAGEHFTRYRGFDLKRNLPLSVKVYDYVIDPDPTVLCFQQNNLTLQTINHPNIIPFYGLYDEGGMSFVIEKFVEGPSLTQILRQRNGQPLPPAEALIYLKALATALEYIHGFGLAHSTLGLPTIQATRDGTIMLTNFAFSRFLDKPMTSTGVFGPPLSQSPEQISGEHVFHTTDIYAMGVLFYEFLTGKHPFLGAPSSTIGDDPESAAKLRQAHLSEQPPDPLKLNPQLPGGISETVLTALAKNPKQRYQSAQEMLEISCAVLGINLDQIPERIGGKPPAAPTQIVQKSDLPAATLGPQYVQVTPEASTAAYPSYAGTPPVVSGGIPGTQMVSGQQRGGTQAVLPGYAPPAPPEEPFGAYEEEHPRRPAWLMPVIVLVGVAILICGAVGVWAGLPILQELFGTASPTPTLTATLTETPTATLAAPTATSEPTFTLPPVIPPSDTPLPVLPTDIPTPEIIFTPTAPRTAFTVTIRNLMGFPIYTFRNGTLMGTDPIPPGMFIYYLNIPAGQQVFRFCVDIRMTQCPEERQILLDEDITIAVQ